MPNKKSRKPKDRSENRPSSKPNPGKSRNSEQGRRSQSGSGQTGSQNDNSGS